MFFVFLHAINIALKKSKIMQNKILIFLIVVLVVIIGVVVNNRNQGDEIAGNIETEEAALGGDPLSGGLVASVSDGVFVGVWVNNNVSKYVIELSPDGIIREYYAGKATNSGTWDSANGILNIDLDGQDYRYQINSVSSDEFQVNYIMSGEVLGFSRIKS